MMADQKQNKNNNNRFSKAFGYRFLMDDSSEYKVVDSYDGWVLESK